MVQKPCVTAVPESPASPAAAYLSFQSTGSPEARTDIIFLSHAATNRLWMQGTNNKWHVDKAASGGVAARGTARGNGGGGGRTHKFVMSRRD